VSIIEKALDKALERDRSLVSPTTGLASGEITAKVVHDERIESSDTPPEPKLTSRIHAINWAALKTKGMLVPEMATTQMAEEYRVIKRPLLMNAFPEEDNGIERANLILVTSSVPGEGKTFTAMNLALSIAMEREKTVLLIDADVAKPSMVGLLGLYAEAGLTDLLKDSSVQFSDIVFKAEDIPNLSLMPAGKPDRHSTELLASDAMKRLANELSARYPDRVVIFDSPPLLAATQGAVLATLVGQVVLVVEADTTPQYIVQESLSKLESCEVVGCVLNKTKKGFFDYYGYFYGYGYGYGYYGQQQRT
jgi:protein-tyrosine kinase